MPRAKRSPERIAEILAAVRQHGSQKAAAAALGIAPSAVSSAMATQPPADSVSGSGEHCELTKTTSERVRTLADLIRVCEIDTTEWTVERWICNKWDSAA